MGEGYPSWRHPQHLISSFLRCCCCCFSQTRKCDKWKKSHISCPWFRPSMIFLKLLVIHCKLGASSLQRIYFPAFNISPLLRAFPSKRPGFDDSLFALLCTCAYLIAKHPQRLKLAVIQSESLFTRASLYSFKDPLFFQWHCSARAYCIAGRFITSSPLQYPFFILFYFLSLPSLLLLHLPA